MAPWSCGDTKQELSQALKVFPSPGSTRTTMDVSCHAEPAQPGCSRVVLSCGAVPPLTTSERSQCCCFLSCSEDPLVLGPKRDVRGAGHHMGKSWACCPQASHQ